MSIVIHIPVHLKSKDSCEGCLLLAKKTNKRSFIRWGCIKKYFGMRKTIKDGKFCYPERPVACIEELGG